MIRNLKRRRMDRNTLHLENLEARQLLTTVTGESEPNDSIASADRFQFDMADGAAELRGTIANDRDRDTFVFTAPQSGTVQLRAPANGSLLPDVDVETVNSVKLFETEPNDGIFGGSFRVSQGQVIRVRVEGKNDTTGSYVVQLRLNGSGPGTPPTPPPTNATDNFTGSDRTESEPNDRLGQANRVNLNGNGQATLRGTSTSDRDRDFFSVTPTDSGLLTIQVRRTAGDMAKLEVTDRFGNQMAETQPNDGRNQVAVRVFAGETIFMRMRAPDDASASYAVDLAFSQPSASSSPSGPVAVFGQNQRGEWWALRSSDDHYENELSDDWSSRVQWQNQMRADVDGDGKDDVIARASSGGWWVTRDAAGTATTEAWGQWSNAVTWHDVMIADVNGDGRDDIVGRAATGGWWVAKSNGSSFTNEAWGRWNPNLEWHDVQRADVNGDGNDDIIARTSRGGWWVARSAGSRFENESWGFWSPQVRWHDVKSADVNGDGKDDIVGRTEGGQWWVAQSGSRGFENRLWGRWSPEVEWENVEVVDSNGDGRDDIVARTSSGSWWVAQSAGNEFRNVALPANLQLAGVVDVFVSQYDDGQPDELTVRLQNGDWWIVELGATPELKRVGSWGASDDWVRIV